MNKLYSNAFKKVLGKLGVQEITPGNVEPTLEANKIKPIGSILFHMMARQQLDMIVKIPCPVENTESDHNKAIINSAKTLRANFSINEKKVCSKCPHRETCPFFAREGQTNNTNALPDLLLYLQTIHNRVDTLQPTKIRFFQSAYKICNDTPSLIEDLKQTQPQILQYEKARAEYATNQTKPEPKQHQSSVAKQQQPSGREASRKPKKIQTQPKDIYGEQSVNQQIGESILKRDQQAENRRRREMENYKKNVQKSREYGDSRPRRFSLDDAYAAPPRQRQQTTTRAMKYEEPNRYKRQQPTSSPRILKYSEEMNKYENRRPVYDRNENYESRKNRNNYEEKRQKKDKGYEDKVKTRSQILYNERKNHAKSLDKVKENEINFEQKFQDAGKVLRNTKILESWDDELATTTSSRPRRDRTEAPPQQQRIKTESQFVEQKAADAEPRRGRRLKK